MYIWTVANQKGGVGKTTTSITLGGLAAQAGLRVVLLDLDPHGSMTCYFRHNPDFQESGCYPLFTQRHNLTREFIKTQMTRTPSQNLDLLAASTALATLERQSIKNDGMGLVISRCLTELWDEYDLAILDCPPQLGVLMINALAACQHLLVPVQTEFLALKGVERLLHTLQMISRSRKKDLPFTIIPTMYDRRTQASVSCLRQLRSTYSDFVWQGKIPIDTKFRDASKAGAFPHHLYPHSRGVEAYQRLLRDMGILEQRVRGTA